MMKNPGGGYQQKFQRLPKRPEISNKNVKKSPAGPATNARGGDMSDYNLKENVSYQTPDDQLYPDNGFTAPPEVYTMNVGPSNQGPNQLWRRRRSWRVRSGRLQNQAHAPIRDV
jgi:hypothetical protein